MKLYERLDPRTLFAVVAANSICVVLLQNAAFCAAAAFVMFLFAFICGADIKGIFIKFKRLWQVIIFASLMQSIFAPSGQRLLQIAGVTLLTTGGLEKGIVIILRLASLMCGAALLMCSGQRRMLQGMIQIKIPYEFAYMVLIGLKFLPALRDEMKDSVTSIQLRGVDLGKIPIHKKAGVYSYLLLPVVANTIVRAQDLAVSIEMRGFRAYPNQTSMVNLKLTWLDYIIILGFMALSAIMLVLYYL